MRRAGRVVVKALLVIDSRCWEAVKEVVDSGLKRCRIRLPLTRSLELIGSASG